MEIKYIIAYNDDAGKDQVHILIDHILSEAGDVLMCGMEIPDYVGSRRSKRRPSNVDMCADCLEAFKQSDHPEAVAYRKAFEDVR